MTTIFLDTSIQTKRALSDVHEFTQIEQIIRSPENRIVTSNYVWMEYQRTIVADYAHIYDVMGQYSDWGQLITHVLDGARAFRPRSAVRCNKIIGKLYAESRQNYEFAYDLIELQIAHKLRQEFWTHVTLVPDTVVCDLVVDGITRRTDDHFSVASSCRKEAATCLLPTFLHENQTKLQKIASYLATHPRAIKDQPRVEKLLQAVIDKPQNVLGQSACWPLGDIIIALHVPDNAYLWTLDADFELCARVLGLKLYR